MSIVKKATARKKNADKSISFLKLRIEIANCVGSKKVKDARWRFPTRKKPARSSRERRLTLTSAVARCTSEFHYLSQERELSV